jgi:uncharacterized membrane protein
VEDNKRALTGFILGLLLILLPLPGEFGGINEDVLFLTAFFLYALALPWIVDGDDKMLLMLMASAAFLALSLGTFWEQPGLATLENSIHDGLEFSAVGYLLLSASGIIYYHVLSKISEKIGIRAFRIQGLLYLIATVGSVTALGMFGLIGWLLAVPGKYIQM